MAKKLQLRRGTTSEHGSFTGAVGEVTVDTDKDVLVVHDGSTAGGFPSVKSGAIAAGDIASNAVTTAKINADAVTGAKIADDSINSEHYVDGSIDTAHLSDDAVTTAKINADAVTGAKIADDAIDSEHYTDASIDAAHIASNAVTTAKINADAVTGAKIADDAIDSEHYTDGSIDTAHIANDQITAALIADNAIDSDMYVDGSIDTAHYAAGSVDNTALGADCVTHQKVADNTIYAVHIVDGSCSNAKIATDAITNVKVANDAIGVAELSASGTANSTSFLRGDNTWAVPGGGKLKQFKYAIKTTTQSITPGTATYGDVSGLSLTIAAASGSNIMLAGGHISTLNPGDHGGRGIISRVLRGSTVVTSATSNGSRIAGNTGNAQTFNHLAPSHSINAIGTFDSTATQTIKVQTAPLQHNTAYINYGSSDSNNSNAGRVVSVLWVMEIEP